MIKAVRALQPVRSYAPRRDYTSVGTCAAVRFIRQHHGLYPLPPGEIFSFAQYLDEEHEVYALISDADPCLELTYCRLSGDLRLSDSHFDALQNQVRRECAECRIGAPYSVTFATRTGIFSFSQRAGKRRQIA